MFKSHISKNLVNLLKKLENLEFEETPNYEEIAQELENIEIMQESELGNIE